MEYFPRRRISPAVCFQSKVWARPFVRPPQRSVLIYFYCVARHVRKEEPKSKQGRQPSQPTCPNKTASSLLIDLHFKVLNLGEKILVPISGGLEPVSLFCDVANEVIAPIQNMIRGKIKLLFLYSGEVDRVSTLTIFGQVQIVPADGYFRISKGDLPSARFYPVPDNSDRNKQSIRVGLQTEKAHPF